MVVSTEVKQLERELDAAALQFSLAERSRTRLSTADPAQTTEVSAARVLTAARNVLAADETAPIEELLANSARHPLLDTKERSQWQAFLVGIRHRLRSTGHEAAPPPEPDTEQSTEQRPRRSSHVPVPITTPLARSIGKRHGVDPTGGSRRRALPRRAVASLAVMLLAGVGAIWWFASERQVETATEGCEGLGCDLGELGERAPESTDTDGRGSAATIAAEAGAPSGRGGITAAGMSEDPPASNETTDPAVAVSAPTPGPGDTATASTITAVDSTTSTAPAETATTTTDAEPDSASTSSITTTRPTTTTTARSATTTGAGADDGQATPTTGRPTSTAQPAANQPATTATGGAVAGAGGVSCPGGSPTLSLDVSRVAADDVLNIRLGPGAGFAIIGGLANDTTGVRVYGDATSGSWVMIQLPGTNVGEANSCGWVHSAFLAAAGTPI